MTRPIVSRTAVRAAIRRAAYSNRAAARGTPGRATTRRPWRRTGGAWRGRRRGALADCREGPRDGTCAELGRDDRAMESLPGERVEEPGGVADHQPRGAGAPGHAVAERAGAGDAVEACSRPPCRGIRRRARGTVEDRDPGHDLVGDRLGPVCGETRGPAPAEDDPDVHPSAGHRGDADVPVAEHAHPRVGAGIAGDGPRGGR